MEFYVIYDFDIPRYRSIAWWKPSVAKRKWRMTEGDDQRNYGYIFGETCKHRKYVAILTKDEMKTFCDEQGLYPEETETMGSITDMGWLPAISFRSDDQESIQGAYVTPLVECKSGCEMSEDQWQRLRRAVINYFS
jgi:hypothetical protein